MKNLDITYHIIGGGIAGLSCAYFIKQKNKNIKTVLYETSDHLGGRACSQWSQNFGKYLDNALHVINASDKFMSRFIKDKEWMRQVSNFTFKDYDIQANSVERNNELICINKTEYLNQYRNKNNILNLLPFIKNRGKFWFSNQNFSQRIINILAAYVDEIYYEHKLQKIETQFGIAAQLKFNKTLVDIGAKDKVILALDNVSCNKLLGAFLLEHNQIINIIYHTSQTIFFPQGTSFLKIDNGLVQGIFVKDNLLTAVISGSECENKKLSNLAVDVWKEIDRIRGVNSGFMPSYEAIHYNYAYAKNSNENNQKKPINALTKYSNVFIAGDWTMKNYLCCIETAVKSADRAVKTALKSAR